MARTARINKGGDHRIANVSKREILFFSEDDRAYTSTRETFQKVAEGPRDGRAEKGARGKGDTHTV